MMQLPGHGPLTCAKCFVGCLSSTIEKNGWRLVNDPGLWGASDPVVLILGQSKGNTQTQTYRNIVEFDSVAFAGVRDRLAAILRQIGVNLDISDLDEHFTARETELAFASLLRCSLSDPNGKTSGSPVRYAMDDPHANEWIVNCMQTWLRRPNPRLRLVVFLGLTDAYVKRVMERLRTLHAGTFKKVKNVVAEAAGVTWVFAQHPSRISENHYQRWISPSAHAKRDLVRSYTVRAFIT